ncbi:unnamed protein product [Darwinula stevensoni]|uniref:AIG1-type G domain-containing protein n=1 Tax=Darwinula stevensoni TaxID=69355 RepID=A0A7R8XDP7_9CRUS|nr:unnamed protein product [Darwinula stevensoni]CAG0889812.1 unnamed protein product [Darwinula stevensoni]
MEKYKYYLTIPGQEGTFRLEVEHRANIELELRESPVAPLLPSSFYLELLDEEEKCYVRLVDYRNLPDRGRLRVCSSEASGGRRSPPPPYTPSDYIPSMYEYKLSFGLEDKQPLYWSPPPPKRDAIYVEERSSQTSMPTRKQVSFAVSMDKGSKGAKEIREQEVRVRRATTYLSPSDSSDADEEMPKGVKSRVRSQSFAGRSRETVKSYDRLAEMVRHEFARNYEAPKDGRPRVYKLRKERTVWRQNELVAKYEVGVRTNVNVEERVLMLVGATGKTTMINGIVNYVYGVDWNDDFRLTLITERKTQTNLEASTRSQTKLVSAYTLHWQQGFRVPYTITVIDTPGFGDTEGLEADRQVLAKVHALFVACKPHGMAFLSGIGFVLPSSVTRITGAQKYVFESVVELFGNDVKNKFYLLVSFSDGQRTNVQDVLKATETIPHDKLFSFNNAALFAANNADEKFQSMFWNMGIQSFAAFFGDFQYSEPVSLVRTVEVLKDRKRLREIMERLEKEIPRVLNRLEELRQTHESLEACKSELEKFKVTKTRTKSIPLPEGDLAINCANCQKRTCEYPSDGNPRLAKCMRPTDLLRCIRCNCDFSLHVGQSWRYEEVVVTKLRSYAWLSRRYAKGSKKVFSKEQLMKKLAVDIRSCQVEVYSMITEARRLMNELRDKALRPTPMTTVEYIDILIEAERGGGRKGGAERIKHLEAAKRASELADDILQGRQDPFPQLRETMEAVGLDLENLQVSESVDSPDSLVETVRAFLIKKFNAGRKSPC